MQDTIIFQADKSLNPEISIQYDELKEQYIARVMSKTGEFTFEAPDRAQLMIQVEDFLYWEDLQLHRAISNDKELDVPRSVGGGSVSHEPSKEQARSKEEEPSKAHGFIGYGIGATKTLGRKTTNLWKRAWGRDKKKRPLSKRHMVIYCGMVIFAATRAGLKKKLTRARNKRVQMIMQHVRQHAKEAAHRKMMTYTKTRRSDLALKRHEAKDLWQERVIRGRHKGGLEIGERINSHKERLALKREAREGWCVSG